MYIALEGIDTCGKSTQIKYLKDKYAQAIITREPGGSVLGTHIRELILKEQTLEQDACMDFKTEFLLFLADRAEHTAKIIKPNQDKLIISDRSLISGIAYAKDILQAKEFNLFATDNILPDLVIILKLDEKTLRYRLGQKPNDTIEQRGVQYLLDIQKNIENITKDLKCDLEIIDASNSIESIHNTISNLINQRI